jgi:hypothetical protein
VGRLHKSAAAVGCTTAAVGCTATGVGCTVAAPLLLLAAPFLHRCRMYADWSIHGIAAALNLRTFDKHEHIVACASRSLNSAEKNYPAWQGEMLAAVCYSRFTQLTQQPASRTRFQSS